MLAVDDVFGIGKKIGDAAQLALELLDENVLDAEALVSQMLASPNTPELHMAYAHYLHPKARQQPRSTCAKQWCPPNHSTAVRCTSSARWQRCCARLHAFHGWLTLHQRIGSPNGLLGRAKCRSRSTLRTLCFSILLSTSVQVLLIREREIGE